jgi:hypothetical protein
MRSVKLNFQSKFLTSPQDKERLKNAVSTAVSALETILGIAKEVAGATGVPGLQAGIGSLVVVLKITRVTPLILCGVETSLTSEQKTFRNVEGAENLAAQIKSLTTVLESSKRDGTLSPEVMDRMDRLSSSVTTHHPIR